MQQTNIIGDTCKDRRIDYDLIDRINKQYEREEKKAKLKTKLEKKKGTQKEEKETEEQNPVTNIKDIKTPDELRDIKGDYTLHKGIYTIDFEINVPKNCGLILEPGVKFLFMKDAGITCEGRFEIKGKSGLEVLLTAKNKAQGWKNLYLKGGAEAIVDYATLSYGKGRMYKYLNMAGGAILLEAQDDLNPSLTINNSYFENNSAELGGAIRNYKGDIIIKEKNRFENNSANEYGGAIHNYQGNVKIEKNNTFENNSAELGGAIRNYKGDIIIKEKNRFKNNSAQEHGGAIHNYQGNVKIEKNNTFENNSAKLGGAIRNYKSKLDIDKAKNTFIGNKPHDISDE